MTYIDGVFTFTRIDEPGQDGGKQTVYIDINGPDGALAEYRAGDQIFQRNSNIRVIYILKDHLGSCGHKLLENNGLWRYEETTPFGQTVMSGFRLNTQQKKFVGKEQDESGLYYYGARNYDPWQCRFVSVDPLWREYPYYTPYQYAGNKPINFIDVEGLQEGQSTPQQEGNIDGVNEDIPLPSGGIDESNFQPTITYDTDNWDAGPSGEATASDTSINDPSTAGNITEEVDIPTSSSRSSRSSVSTSGNLGGNGTGGGTTNYGGGQAGANKGSAASSSNGIGPGGQAAPTGGSDGAGGGFSARNQDLLSLIQPISPGPIAERVPLEIQAPDLIDGPSDPSLVPPGVSIFLGTIGLWASIGENSITDPYRWNKRITPIERESFKNAAKPFRILGKFTGGLAVGLDVKNLWENYKIGNSRGVLKSSLSAAFGVGAIFGGPIGWAGAILFGIADATGLVDQLINVFY